MDIFDIFCKKIGYRKLSKREKILSFILILLITEFLFYNFLIKNELKNISELEIEDEPQVEVENYKFKGFENFSQDNLEKISQENSLNTDNFSKEGKSDIESLYIMGKIDSKNIGKLEKLTNYYGYSDISFKRSDEENFNYKFRAEKPSEAIYYSDLKKAYFKEDDKESPKKDEIKKEDTGKSKNIENIKNTKENIKNTKENVKIKKTSPSKSKKVSLAKNKEKAYIKGHEEIISNEGNNLQLNYYNEKNDLREIGNEHENLDYYEKDYNLIADDEINIKYYGDSGLTSVFVDEKNLSDLVRLGLDRSCDGISLSLYFPYPSCSELGTINSSGEKVPFTGEIYEKEWFRINLFQYDISDIYFIPQNDKDLFLFIKEVDFHEEV